MKAQSTVLYLGDTELTGAARYLAGSMTALGIPYDYRPSDRPPARGFLSRSYRLYILSDYPRRNFSMAQMRHIARQVRRGSSLLMIGGWASFYGQEGEYHASELAHLLPVTCARSDDRRQGAQAYRIVRTRSAGRQGQAECWTQWGSSHSPLFTALDFDDAPGICGYNQVRRKRGARELLTVQTIGFRRSGRTYRVLRTDPLYVVSASGKGTVAALMTDLAPHWAGGLVDWGSQRLRITAKSGIDIEIGNWYLALIRELLVSLGATRAVPGTFCQSSTKMVPGTARYRRGQGV